MYITVIEVNPDHSSLFTLIEVHDFVYLSPPLHAPHLTFYLGLPAAGLGLQFFGTGTQLEPVSVHD
jgi:hypothetical protein